MSLAGRDPLQAGASGTAESAAKAHQAKTTFGHGLRRSVYGTGASLSCGALLPIDVMPIWQGSEVWRGHVCTVGSHDSVTAEGQMCGFVTLEVLDAAVFHPELMQRKGCLTPGRCQDALVNASSSAHLGARD